MSFPGYPHYRQSGVPWMASVPDQWGILPFRYVFRESPEKIDGEVFGEMLSVSGYRGIEVKEYDDDNRRRSAEELQGYRIVRPGQLVVNTMWLNHTGLGVSDVGGHVSPAYRAYWVRGDWSLRYVHYLMRSSAYVDGYTQLLTGVRPNSLQMSREDLMRFPVLFPPLSDQHAIAAVLDRETARIDALVAEQERLIELLREKRQAVISHAVTKGLDPTVPMKDSGVEWLGEVPAHWNVKRVVHWFEQIGSGTTPDTQNPDYYGGDTPWVTTAELRERPITQTQKSVTSLALREHSALRVFPPETVLIAMYGATIGRTGMLEVSAAMNQACCGFAGGRGMRPAFFYAWLQAFRPRIVELGDGGGQPNISQEKLRSLRVAAPDVSEQDDILEIISRELSRADALLAEAERAIDLLKERRSALISAAVTGQIDVRGVAPEATS